MVIEVRELKKQMDDRLKKNSDAALKTALDAFREKLTAVEEEVYQVRNRSGQDPLNFPIKLNNKMAALEREHRAAATASRPPRRTRCSKTRDQGPFRRPARCALKTDLPAVNKLLADRHLDALVVTTTESKPSGAASMKTLVIYSLCLTMAAPAVWSADTAPLRGYSSEAARTEREWEAKFRAIPDPATLRAYMQRLSARPHHVGSPYDKDNAEWIAAKFKEWGLDAQIETFDVLFPTPKERVLELVEPTHVTAKLAEPAVAGDPTSAQHERAAADLQRLLHRRRRHRAAGLRELRHPGGLRGARAPGHLGEGRHRDRALRRKLARHQAQGRRRARRGRLPDLFRPARRRLRAGRRLSRRPVSARATACSAAA